MTSYKGLFKRMLLSFAGIALAVYGGIVVLFYVAQDKVLFISTKDLYRTPEENGWAYQDVVIPMGGDSTHAWFIPAENDSRGVVLFSHGNAGNIADRLESVSLFRQLGFDVLVYDYGGYGRSTGKTSERRCYEDIRAMWGWLTEDKALPPERIILFGRSLGAGATCQLATEVEAAGVVIESAFLSVPTLGSEIYPFLPVKLLAKNRFENEAKISSLRSPLLIVHSPDDDIIPYRHGKALFELAKDPKDFLEISGGHNDGFWQSGEHYLQGLDTFISRVLNH